jgi:hypothetical protein
MAINGVKQPVEQIDDGNHTNSYSGRNKVTTAARKQRRPNPCSDNSNPSHKKAGNGIDLKEEGRSCMIVE